MAMMGALGAISGSISVGGRVANERHIGWNRQLRLTPLPGWGYLAVKAAAMLVVLPALLLVFGVAAVVKGVELGVGTWIAVLLTAWLSVLPAALASAAQLLPSYWIVAETLGQVSGAGLDAGGVLVLLAWLVAVGALVIVRYRRDALRV